MLARPHSMRRRTGCTRRLLDLGFCENDMLSYNRVVLANTKNDSKGPNGKKRKWIDLIAWILLLSSFAFAAANLLAPEN